MRHDDYWSNREIAELRAEVERLRAENAGLRADVGRLMDECDRWRGELGLPAAYTRGLPVDAREETT